MKRAKARTKTTNAQVNNRVKMGRYLRTMREKRGHTQTQVASAIGRRATYVSEVETGGRGARMSPVTAYIWAHYLGFNPEILFDYLGYESEYARYQDVRHYLETTAWATRLLRARKKANEALQHVDSLLDELSDRVHKDIARDLRTSLREIEALLHTSRTMEAAE